MNKALEKILVERYPTIFKQYGGNPKDTCMAWGIAVGQGWFNLIDDLCKKLSKFGDEVVAEQVKEKFGGLRFYIGSVTKENYEEIYKYIEEAESKSVITCEYCGEPGERRGKGWVKTVCHKCAQQNGFIIDLEKEAVAYKVFDDGHIELYNIDGILIYAVPFKHFMERISQRFGFIEKDLVEKFKNANVDGGSKNPV